MRINDLASLITEKQNLIVDIGSDHAFLSKLIIDKDLANKVINLEKNDGPLQNGINNTNSPKYQSRIENIKSDGLKEIDPSLLIDTCFICGMGGKTIVKILDDALDKKVKQYILQPNNNEADIRKWANKNLWKISKELVIQDNGIYYEIICLSKKEGYYPIFKKDIIFGRQNIKSQNKLFLEKWSAYFQAHEEIIRNQRNHELNNLYEMFKKVSKHESK